MNSFGLLMLVIAGFFTAMVLMRALTLHDFSSTKQLIEAIAIFIVSAGFGGYVLLTTYALMPFLVGIATYIVGICAGLKWTDHVEDKHANN